ncbi:MAG TPA: tetratricopeptide repeat protein [Kofleriaceae bacterium]
MTRRLGVAPRRIAAPLAIAGLLAATAARADTVDDHLAQVRVLYDKGDFAHARDELLAAYQLEPRPELLFALGQVELHLGHYAQAIEDYEQFIATNPAADQAALAQQAIGAARAKLAEKPAVPPPPPPPPHRAWDGVDTGIAAGGGATMALGAGLAIYGHHRATDHSGTLSQYNARFSRATVTQWVGAGCLAAGALAAGGAVLRWRFHLIATEIQPIATPGAVGVTWTGRW